MSTDKDNENEKNGNLPIFDVKQCLTLKNENALRKHYFKTIQTSAKNHYLPFKPRWLNKIYAHINAFFWLPCPKCGQNFGGHEWYGSENMRGVCPTCVVKHFNKTGNFSNDNIA